ncbi:MAG: KEOPS complex subunit Cgi121 [Nitrososphaerota archaeon]
MEAIIKSSYKGYRFAAALICGVKHNPLELLSRDSTEGGAAIQILRPDIVVSERHLVAAFAAAVASISAGYARSKRVEMEFLLKLSAKRQIQDALRIAGLTGGEDTVIVAAISPTREDPEPLVKKAAEILGGSIEPFRRVASRERLMQIFEISERKLGAVAKGENVDPLELLIIEKVVSSYVE